MGKNPNWVGDGVAVWLNTDKNGDQYATVQLFGKNGLRVNCFKPREREESAEMPKDKAKLGKDW